jgi:hypothetical protein
VAQLVVVDQVFVAQRQRKDPLTDQGSNIAEAEAFSVAEGNMCGTDMRGADALPRSKTPSRTKGSRRNLGDPPPGQRRLAALGPHREGEEP